MSADCIGTSKSLHPGVGTTDSSRVSTAGPTDRGTATQRVGSVAVYAAGPVAIVAIIGLSRAGLIADTPVWMIAAAILSAGVFNFFGTMWWNANPGSEIRLQVRIASSVLTTAAVIYLAGWGPVLLIAFALGSAELLRVVGPRSIRPNIVWNWIAIVIGELGVTLGWFPTMIDTNLGRAIAIAGGVCLMIVTDVLGRNARAAADAEDALRRRSAYFEDLVERATDIIGVIRTTGTVDSVSPAVERILGYSPDEVRNQPIAKFLDAEQALGVDAVLAKVIRERGLPTVVEVTLRHRDGSNRTVIATLTCPNDTWGDEVIMNLHDVTTQRELEELLRHDARHDHLTGLLNRVAFGDATTRAATTAERRGCSIGMLYIDLDGFKEINDSLGHETGDRVLVETAARLSDCLVPGEVLARLGGDEFAILVECTEGDSRAVALAECILTAVSEPIPHLHNDVRVGASIGIAVRDAAGIEISTLMREADEAMYSAKRNGRSRWEFSRPIPR